MSSNAFKKRPTVPELENELRALREKHVQAQSSLDLVTKSLRWRLLQKCLSLMHFVLPERSRARERLKSAARNCYRFWRSGLAAITHSEPAQISAPPDARSEAALWGAVPVHELAMEITPACSEVRRFVPADVELFPYDMVNGSKVSWELSINNGVLRGVGVLLGTHGRVNAGSLELELRIVPGGSVVRRCALQAQDIVDNQCRLFLFDRPLDLDKELSGGEKRISATLCGVGAQHENCVALWCGSSSGEHASPRVLQGGTRHTFYPWNNDQVERGLRFVPRYEVQDCRGLRYGFKGAQQHAHDLRVEAPCRFRFPILKERLETIQFLFGTHGRINRCRLQLELGWYDRGKYLALAQTEIECSLLHDNQPVLFEFPRYPDSAKELYAALRSPDAEEKNFIAVWGGVHGQCFGSEEQYYHPLREEYLGAKPGELGVVDTIYPSQGTVSSSKERILVIPCGHNFSGLAVVSADLERAFKQREIEIDYCSIAELHRNLENLKRWSLIILVRQLIDGDQIREFIHKAKKHGIQVVSVLDIDSDLEKLQVLSQAGAGEHAQLNARAKQIQEALQLTVESSDAVVGAEGEIAALCKSSKIFSADKLGQAALELLDAARNGENSLMLPTVQFVTVLYRKERELQFTSQCYRNQTYPGLIEFTFVDDCCPERSSFVVDQELSAWKNGQDKQRKFNLIRNPSNSGNCASRNTAIQSSNSEIIIVVDADCVINDEFVAQHVQAHQAPDCDVVIGPFNLESRERDPLQVISAYGANPALADREADLQDKLNRHGLLNCITRNFSIKRSFLKNLDGELFDELFGYSADPISGFGWEDVEMGYRLYRAGARIKYIDAAVSVHVSHPPTTSEHSKAARSQLNFRRLLEKHPEMALIARRWVLDTYQKIKKWCAQSDCGENEDRLFLEQVLSDRVPVLRTSAEIGNLRILTYRWHCPHQYELYKLGANFDLVHDAGTEMCRGWNVEERPQPANSSFIPMQEALQREYDLAILHFDENVLDPENTNGVHGEEWGRTFRWLRENARAPLIAVCHGTPQFVGQFDPNYVGDDLGQIMEESRSKLVQYLSDVDVVCNSYQAQREWGFAKSRVIWQGFDPSEFKPATYSRAVVSLGASMRERPIYRGYFLCQQILERLPKEYHAQQLDVPKPGIYYSRLESNYAQAKFQNYVDTLRAFSVYLNPTLRSPMPRSRGEAMLCGLVTVSAANHDVQMFIKNGYNGFYSNDAGELADYILFLMSNRSALESIGMRGRLTAANLFNHDRYLLQWQAAIKDLIGF